ANCAERPKRRRSRAWTTPCSTISGSAAPASSRSTSGREAHGRFLHDRTRLHARYGSRRAGRLRYFFNTLGETNPVYRDLAAAKAAGFSATPVPPTYLFCLEMMDTERPFEMLEALNMDLPKILHGEQKFIYHAPVVVGDVLTFRSEIADVVQKKGGAMTLITVTTK